MARSAGATGAGGVLAAMGGGSYSSRLPNWTHDSRSRKGVSTKSTKRYEKDGLSNFSDSPGSLRLAVAQCVSPASRREKGRARQIFTGAPAADAEASGTPAIRQAQTPALRDHALRGVRDKGRAALDKGNQTQRESNYLSAARKKSGGRRSGVVGKVGCLPETFAPSAGRRRSAPSRWPTAGSARGFPVPTPWRGGTSGSSVLFSGNARDARRAGPARRRGWRRRNGASRDRRHTR